MNLSFFIFRKYLWSHNNESLIRKIFGLSFISIFASTFTLCLAISLMLGFRTAIYKDLKSLSGDAVILPNNQSLNKSVLASLKSNKKIKAFSCNEYHPAILSQDQESFWPITITGVVFEDFFETTSFQRKIKHGSTSYDYLNQLNMTAVGKKFCEQNNLSLGEQFAILKPKIVKKKVSFEEKKLMIGAIFETGFDDYDQGMVICSKRTFDSCFKKANHSNAQIKFNINQESSNLIKLKLGFEKILGLISGREHELSILINKIFLLKNHLPKHKIIPWTQISPGIIEPLKFEQTMIFLILMLIFLLSLSGILSFVYLKIISKKKDIAILATLGAKNSDLKKSFMMIAGTIGFTGSMLGSTCAFLAGYILKNNHLIKLPSNYFIQRVLVDLDPFVFFIIFAFINAIIIIACTIPLRTIDSMNFSEILKN